MLSLIVVAALSFASPPLCGVAVCRGGRRITSIVARKKDDKWARAAPVGEPLTAGSVICAAPGSFDHYFMESLVLLIEHDEREGSVGVLLNHETPWTVADMVGDPTSDVVRGFGENAMFLGGDAGSDTMLMLHELPLLEGARQLNPAKYDPDRPKALCIGGVGTAAELVATGVLRASQFKFFYKTVEWLPGQLAQQFSDGIFEHIELSSSLLLGQSGQKMMWDEVRELMRAAERRSVEGRGGDAEAAEEVPIIENLPATRYAPAANSKAAEALSSGRASAEASPTTAAPPPASAPPAAPSPPAPPADANTIVEVVAHRTFKGNEQWQVRWGGDGTCTSWETREVILASGSEELAERADALRG